MGYGTTGLNGPIFFFFLCLAVISQYCACPPDLGGPAPSPRLAAFLKMTTGLGVAQTATGLRRSRRVSAAQNLATAASSKMRGDGGGGGADEDRVETIIDVSKERETVDIEEEVGEGADDGQLGGLDLTDCREMNVAHQKGNTPLLLPFHSVTTLLVPSSSSPPPPLFFFPFLLFD